MSRDQTVPASDPVHETGEDSDGRFHRRTYLQLLGVAIGVGSTSVTQVAAETSQDGYGEGGYGAGAYGDPTALRVLTDGPLNVSQSSATLNGTLEDLGGASSVDVAFQWGPKGEGVPNTTAGQSLSTTDSFAAELSDLDADTAYEYRAVARAGDETATGDTRTFRTEPDEPSTPAITTFEVRAQSNPQWARVRVDWAVSRDDGGLDSVTSALVRDGRKLDSQTTQVSGSESAGDHRLRVRHGHDATYDVTLTVTDVAGNSVSETVELTL